MKVGKKEGKEDKRTKFNNSISSIHNILRINITFIVIPSVVPLEKKDKE